MKRLKPYLAAIVSLCIIAAASPYMTYASTAEYDNTGAIWDSAADITELTEVNAEEASVFSCEMEDTARILADDVENEPEMDPGETAFWPEDDVNATVDAPAEPTEEMVSHKIEKGSGRFSGRRRRDGDFK